MNRLCLGLTDHERRVLEQRRRTRNCLCALGCMILVVGFIAAH